MSLSRIATNLQSLQSHTSLTRTNEKMSIAQLRLSTGSRINRAEDDSAGYSIGKKLESRIRGQAQALANVGDAKSMLTVGEGALNTVMDILQTMKEKAIQANNDTLAESERDAIQNQMDALIREIDDLNNNTEFNGTQILGATADLAFHVGADSSATFTVASGAGGALGGVDSSDLSLSGAVTVDSASTTATRSTSIQNIENAIQTVSDQLGQLGDEQKRLSFKQDNLRTSINNYEGAKSRIMDADFAKEQMDMVKYQILQQTGTSSLAQANSAPQIVLSLF